MQAMNSRLNYFLSKSISRMMKSKIAFKNVEEYVREPDLNLLLDKQSAGAITPPMILFDSQALQPEGLQKRMSRRMTLQSKEIEAETDGMVSPDAQSMRKRRIFDRTGSLFKPVAAGEDDDDEGGGVKDEAVQAEQRGDEPDPRNLLESPTRSNRVPSNESGDSNSPQARRVKTQIGPHTRVLRKSTTLTLGQDNKDPNNSSEIKPKLKQISEEDRFAEAGLGFRLSDKGNFKSSQILRRRRDPDLSASNLLVIEQDNSPTNVSKRLSASNALEIDDSRARHRRAGSGQQQRGDLYEDYTSKPFDEYLIKEVEGRGPFVSSSLREQKNVETDGEFKARLLNLQKVFSSLKRKRLRIFFNICIRLRVELQDSVREKLERVIQSPAQIRKSVKEGIERLDLTKNAPQTPRPSYSAIDISQNKNIESEKFVIIARTLIRAQNNNRLGGAFHTLVRHKDFLNAEQARKHQISKELHTLIVKNHNRNAKYFLHKIYTQTKLKSLQIRSKEERSAVLIRLSEKLHSTIDKAGIRLKLASLGMISYKAKFYIPSRAYIRIAAVYLHNNQKERFLSTFASLVLSKNKHSQPFVKLEKVMTLARSRNQTLAWRNIIVENIRSELEEELQKRMRFKLLKTGAIRKLILGGSTKKATDALQRMRLNISYQRIIELNAAIKLQKKVRMLKNLTSSSNSKVSSALRYLLRQFSTSVVFEGSKKLNYFTMKYLFKNMSSAQKQKVISCLILMIRNSLSREKTRHLSSILGRLKSLTRTSMQAGFSQLNLYSESILMIHSRRSLCISQGMAMLPTFFRPNLVLGFRMIFEKSYGVQKTKQTILKRLEISQAVKTGDALRKMLLFAGMKVKEEERFFDNKQKLLKSVLRDAHWRFMVNVLAVLKHSSVDNQIRQKKEEIINQKKHDGILRIKGFYKAMEQRAFNEFVLSAERINSGLWKEKYHGAVKLRLLAKVIFNTNSLLRQSLNKLQGQVAISKSKEKLKEFTKSKSLRKLVLCLQLKLQESFSTLLLSSTKSVLRAKGCEWLCNTIQRATRPLKRTAIDNILMRPMIQSECNQKFTTLATLIARKCTQVPFAVIKGRSKLSLGITSLEALCSKVDVRVAFRQISIIGQNRFNKKQQNEFRRTIAIVVLIEKFNKLSSSRVTDAFWRCCVAGVKRMLRDQVEISDSLKRLIKIQLVLRIAATFNSYKQVAMIKLRAHCTLRRAQILVRSLTLISKSRFRALDFGFIHMKLYQKPKLFVTASINTEKTQVRSIETETLPILEIPKTQAFSQTEAPNMSHFTDQTVKPSLAEIPTQTTKIDQIFASTQTALISEFNKDLTKVSKDRSSFTQSYNYKPSVRNVDTQFTVTTRDVLVEPLPVVLNVEKQKNIVVERNPFKMESIKFVSSPKPRPVLKHQGNETDKIQLNFQTQTPIIVPKKPTAVASIKFASMSRPKLARKDTATETEKIQLVVEPRNPISILARKTELQRVMFKSQRKQVPTPRSQMVETDPVILTLQQRAGLSIPRKYPKIEIVNFKGEGQKARTLLSQATETDPEPVRAQPEYVSVGTTPEKPELVSIEVDVPSPAVELLRIDLAQQDKPINILPRPHLLNLPIVKSPVAQTDQAVEEFEVKSYEERRNSDDLSALGSFRTADRKRGLAGYRNTNDKDPFGFKIGNIIPKGLVTDRGINRTDTKRLFESREESRNSSIQPKIPKNRINTDSCDTVSKFPKNNESNERGNSVAFKGGERSTNDYSLLSKHDKVYGLRSPGAEMSIGIYERFNTQEDERRDTREGALMLAMFFSSKGAGKTNTRHKELRRDAFLMIKIASLTTKGKHLSFIASESRTESSAEATLIPKPRGLVYPLATSLHRLFTPCKMQAFSMLKDYSHKNKMAVIAFQLHALEVSVKEDIEERAKEALNILREEEDSLLNKAYLLNWANSFGGVSTEN
jgi:hypothetical protein